MDEVADPEPVRRLLDGEVVEHRAVDPALGERLSVLRQPDVGQPPQHGRRVQLGRRVAVLDVAVYRQRRAAPAFPEKKKKKFNKVIKPYDRL